MAKICHRMFLGNGDVKVDVFMEHCHRILSETGTPVNWVTSEADSVWKATRIL